MEKTKEENDSQRSSLSQAIVQAGSVSLVRFANVGSTKNHCEVFGENYLHKLFHKKIKCLLNASSITISSKEQKARKELIET